MAKRRKKATSTSTLKVKVGGRNKIFKKVSCSRTKTDAKKRADGIRKRGGTARVVKQGGAYCVFKGPKAKKRKKR